MQLQDLTALVLLGGAGNSPVEQAMHTGLAAAGADLVGTLAAAGVTRVVLATKGDPPLLPAATCEVIVDRDAPGPFHFGQRLAGLVERYAVRHMLYSGCGSAPLMSAPAWRDALGQLDRFPVVTNNLHSSDWVACRVDAAVLQAVAGVERDNSLAWILAEELQRPCLALPLTADTRFDLDTPVDLLIAQRHPRAGQHLRAYTRGLGWDTRRVDGVLEVLRREGGHLALIGRTSAAVWAAVERAARCWVRVYAEERGMVASGRLRRGEVRSLLADQVRAVGLSTFFEQLEGSVDGIVMDSRVVMAASGPWPSAADRFNSDLLDSQAVGDPFVRAFTEAAGRLHAPILLGGQSVVSGGLLALLDLLRNPEEG